MTWSHDGKKIAFLSERRGPANLYVLSLQKPPAPGYTERRFLGGTSVSIDWDDIHCAPSRPRPWRR